MACLCIVDSCPCMKFSQSAFSGFTNPECSNCSHSRKAHLTRTIALSTYVHSLGRDISGESCLRILRRIHDVKEKEKEHLFGVLNNFLRKRKNDEETSNSYLFVLPSDVLKIMTTYFVISIQLDP